MSGAMNISKFAQKCSQNAITGWNLHQDIASVCHAHITQQGIDEFEVEIMAHSPYSPDLARCDFFLFPEVKKKLRKQILFR